MSYEVSVQHTINNKYWYLTDVPVKGIVVHSVGVPQPKAQPHVNYFNTPNTTASVHGFIEPGLIVETAPMWSRKGWMKKCYHVGSGPKGSRNSTHLGLEMCEPSTIKYTGGFGFQDLNPAATKQYLKAVTETTVEICADLCIFHDLPVSSITTHWRSYLEGVGCAHGDPDHIWPVIDYSLEKFRKDVQDTINRKKGDILANMTREEFERILDDRFAQLGGKVYKDLKDVPDWGQDAVKKLQKAGALQGTDKGLDLSHDLLRTLVILDRMGLFNK